MRLAPELLAGRIWRFGREDGQIFARGLILHPDGSIGDFAADNEVRWWPEDGLLCFVAVRRAVTTKFTCVEVRDDGSLLLRSEMVRVGFLKRKFFDDLRVAEKAFMRKGTDSTALQDVLPLHRRLRGFGRTTLLWVLAADAEAKVGAVECVEEGLLRGYVRRFVPYTCAAEFDADGWGRLCKAAHAIAFATT